MMPDQPFNDHNRSAQSISSAQPIQYTHVLGFRLGLGPTLPAADPSPTPIPIPGLVSGKCEFKLVLDHLKI